jgi:PKD domain/Kelch motif
MTGRLGQRRDGWRILAVAVTVLSLTALMPAGPPITGGQGQSPSPVSTTLPLTPSDPIHHAAGGCTGVGTASPTCSPLGVDSSTRPSAAATWWNLTSRSPAAPAPRTGMAAVFDPIDGYLLLFGGRNATFVFGDTWTFANGVWTELFPSSSPSARFWAGATWDAGGQDVLLFGGSYNATTFFGDTWTFHHGVWTQLTLSVAPTAREAPQMAYDYSDSMVILFGGLDRTATAFADTWKFVGGGWSHLFPSSSPVADAAGMFTYDGTDGYLVLFGGTNNTATFGFTWIYHAGVWTELFPAVAPSARLFPSADVAPFLSGTVLFSGLTSSAAVPGDLWLFHGGGWTQLAATTALGSRGLGSLSYDGRGGLDYFGGELAPIPGRLVAETWSYAAPLMLNITPNFPISDVGAGEGFTTLSSGGVAPTTVNWSFGDSTPNGSLGFHRFTRTGVFTVHATMLDLVGQSVNATTFVTVVAAPKVVLGFTFHGHPSPVVNTTVQFTATVTKGVPPYRYLWTFSDGSTLAVPNANHTFTSTGPAGVRLNVTDSANGVALASLNFTVVGETSSSSSWLLPLVIIGVVVAVVAVVAVLLLRRRRPPAPSPGAANPPPPGTPQPPSPPVY